MLLPTFTGEKEVRLKKLEKANTQKQTAQRKKKHKNTGFTHVSVLIQGKTNTNKIVMRMITSLRMSRF